MDSPARGLPSCHHGVVRRRLCRCRYCHRYRGNCHEGLDRLGTGGVPERDPLATFIAERWPRSRFRRHLHASIRYVMGDAELDGVFDESGQRTLLLFTSRVRRRDGRSLGRADLARLFTMAATRKLPRLLKYVPLKRPSFLGH